MEIQYYSAKIKTPPLFYINLDIKDIIIMLREKYHKFQ